MFERDSKENIWVSANQTGAGDGSVENPFRQLKDAIEKVNSGSTVVLKEGIYNETLSLSHTKGEELKPITIMADPQSGPVIFHSEWYLYEVSDLIIDGICFENISNSAISIVGVSERNIFKNLTFTNCGIQSECTLFMGGSGGRFNIVEHCSFSCDEQLQNQIALMISQSIDSEDESIKITKNSVVRYSSFTNYGMPSLLGVEIPLMRLGITLLKRIFLPTASKLLVSKLLVLRYKKISSRVPKLPSPILQELTLILPKTVLNRVKRDSSAKREISLFTKISFWRVVSKQIQKIERHFLLLFIIIPLSSKSLRRVL